MRAMVVVVGTKKLLALVFTALVTVTPDAEGKRDHQTLRPRGGITQHHTGACSACSATCS